MLNRILSIFGLKINVELTIEITQIETPDHDYEAMVGETIAVVDDWETTHDCRIEAITPCPYGSGELVAYAVDTTNWFSDYIPVQSLYADYLAYIES